MSRTTLEAVINQVRVQLSTYRNEFLTLADPVGPTDTEIRVAPALTPGLRAGSLISVGFERMRVISVDPGPRLVQVVRSWSSHQPPGSHAVGSDVWVNSRFDTPSIADALYDEIESWDMDLFRVDDALVAVNSEGLIPLPPQFVEPLGVVGVRRRAAAGAVDTATEVWPEAKYRVVYGPKLLSNPASGMAIRLLEPVSTAEIHVTVGLPFDLSSWAPTTDLVGEVGLRPSMLDVARFGARWRLVSDSEAGRTARIAQGESRVAEETPPGAAGDEALRIYAMYMRRKQTEVLRFRSMFPLRRS